MGKYNHDFAMQYTDNPYVDIIVNCVKILGMNAVVKNENQALHYEDKRSAAAAEKLIRFKEGLWDSARNGQYNEGMYTEWNSYYRMLFGLPPLYTMKEEEEYLKMYAISDDHYQYLGGDTFVIPELLTRYYIDMGQYDEKYTGRYLHELSQEELDVIMVNNGIFDRITQDYTDPHYQYIYHLGDKRVDPYTARKANNYTLLYVPRIDKYNIVVDKFKRVFERNRAFTMASIYSEAYRFMSYDYDNFIHILIIIQTMVDLISEVQEYIINKDVFDSRTIRYLFESYGIAYYKEIPIKYQVRIIKNVNKLLKYKSSHRNIVDILELFDSTDVEIFTYYISKIKKVARDDFFYYTEDDVNPKYNTNRTYYIGDIKDYSNGKYPLMDVKSTDNDDTFICKYLVNCYRKPDISYKEYIARNYNQPVVDKVIELVEDFLNNTAMVNGYGWFGADAYTHDDPEQGIDYKLNRKKYLEDMYDVLTAYYLEKLVNRNYTVVLNKYNYRHTMYLLYGALGIFDYDNAKDYIDTSTDDELQSFFYSNSDIISLDKVPYLKAYNSSSSHDIGIFDYIMFASSEDRIGDLYKKYIEAFVESYVVYVKYMVEDIYKDFEYDELTNTSPRYVGWIQANDLHDIVHTKPSMNIAVNTTGKNIPIYRMSHNRDIVTEDMIGTEYFRKNYDLCFIKVPVEESNAYSIMGQYDLRRDYDTVTLADPFWDGISNYDIISDEDRAALHEEKRKEILSKDFTIERTKYLAVEATIDLVKMSTQFAYFMNMLTDAFKNEESLMVTLDESIASEPVRLNDLMTFVTALNFMYNGIEPDNISSNLSNIQYINGFNFGESLLNGESVDWTTLYNDMEKLLLSYDKEDPNMSLESWQTTEILDQMSALTSDLDRMNKLKEIYNTNMNLYDHLRYMMKNAESKEIYDIYNILYKSRMEVENSNKYYTMTNSDGTAIFTDANDTSQTYYLEITDEVQVDEYGYPIFVGVVLEREDGIRFKVIGTDKDIESYYIELEDVFAKYQDGSLHKGIRVAGRSVHKPLYRIRVVNPNGDDYYLGLGDVYVNIDGSRYSNSLKVSTENYPIYQSTFVESENLYTFDIKTAHDTKGGVCRYIGPDGTRINSMYISYKDENKEYLVYHNDGTVPSHITDYTIPAKDNWLFYMYTKPTFRLVNKDNPNIRIKLDVDEEGELVIPSGIVLDTRNNITHPLAAGEVLKPYERLIQIENKVANNYYEFLEYRNQSLYAHLVDLKYNYKTNVITDKYGSSMYVISDDKAKRIETLCESIALSLEKYFDKKEWKYIFNYIPTCNIQNIQSYIMKMVIFFKSWKTQLVDTAINYLINDDVNNRVQILESVHFGPMYTFVEKPRPKDIPAFKSILEYRDIMSMREDVTIEYK